MRARTRFRGMGKIAQQESKKQAPDICHVYAETAHRILRILKRDILAANKPSGKMNDNFVKSGEFQMSGDPRQNCQFAR